MAAVAVDVDPRHWGAESGLQGGGHGSVNKQCVRGARRSADARWTDEMDESCHGAPPQRAPPAQTIAHTALTLSPLAWLARATAPFASLSNIALWPPVSVCGSQCGAL